MENDISALKIANYSLKMNNKNEYFLFITGYLLGQKDDKLEQKISYYINNEYSVDIVYNTFFEQLSSLSSLLNLNILETFIHVLSKISDKIVVQDTRFIDLPKIIHQQENTLLKVTDNVVLKIGDFIKLKDKIGDSYKETKFFNQECINPDWSLFYPSEEFDFKSLQFYYLNENSINILNNVWRLFSTTIHEIKKIVIEDGKYIAYSDFIRIDIYDALLYDEIVIINDHQSYNVNDFSELLHEIDNYRLGVSEYNSFSELMGFYCFYNLKSFEKK